ncbi:xanthine dehydrogenase molybdopterin binding subunit [Uliginosibacterium sp. TH139]|uniref:xanthine dehydrogenase molybdopterin binding subunit n=1 Tax=Uliginosibacterium sp. TH139 TaxID=2067453 RepID=UPI000C7AFC55|nr:xanthine dehydrogenase molybdopterin binding subunit [Uliginosibacterium sp. TH139]PLK49091.1 xanthine dehydrogenase molybdopterin binding subunit [Uliginosibacterium sp. TH139]
MTHPVGAPLRHESATLHVQGAARYIDDLPAPAGCLHAAFGLASIAHGRILAMDLAAVLAAPGVVAVLTAQDIPASNDCGPIVHDDPILADGLVHFMGQPLFLVLAESHEQARRAARLAKLEYDTLPAILDIPNAIAAESWLMPPVHVQRGDADKALASAPHRLQGRATLGGQEHFYLESQIALAIPREEGSLHVQSSTQHPTEMQQTIAHMLGWAAHQVSVECRRMGGAFGGKESQSAQVASAAALGAWKTGRAVKLRLDRDDDMLITGKRHDFAYEWEAGFDDHGQLQGLAITLASRCGFSTDLSGPVNDRAIFHLDNCYYLDAVAIRSLRCRTNTVSNTAFRGFGGPQGIFAIEYILDDIAHHLGLDPLEVRRRNFYGLPGNDACTTTHYGMPVQDNVAPQLVDQLAQDCDYSARRAAIAAFNATSPVLKRGIALTPVKFGISFTATHYNQAGAQVCVYADGSVLVTHGGTEMGQGLYTKIAQIVAQALGLSIDRVRLSSTDTSRVPNTSATAASSGTDLNGQAALAAARKIRKRLTDFFSTRHGLRGAKIEFADGKVSAGEISEDFTTLTAAAYRARVQLWDSGFYATPKIHYDPASLQGRPFFYFAYGACCAEVVIDTLTGESRILRADILHDAGRSINPALDIGQVEGAFIQGAGWITSEELVFDGVGRLRTHAPSTYKIPAASDCPPVLNVKLFDNINAENSIHRSKAVGEPPLVHGFAAFFALRDACSAALGAPAPLQAPATPEAILRAIGGLNV